MDDAEIWKLEQHERRAGIHGLAGGRRQESRRPSHAQWHALVIRFRWIDARKLEDCVKLGQPEIDVPVDELEKKVRHTGLHRCSG